jgi:hypothetical protein
MSVQQSLSQQRQAASLEEDQRLVETLAARRAELQQALQQQQGNEECWMATNKASFFLVPKEPVAILLQKELEQVEQNLRVLCDNILKATQQAQEQTSE